MLVLRSHIHIFVRCVSILHINHKRILKKLKKIVDLFSNYSYIKRNNLIYFFSTCPQSFSQNVFAA